MITWIIYVLIAVVLWSLVNIADSYLVERNKKIGHPIGSLVIFSSVLAIVVSFVIWIIVKDVYLPTKDILILLVAGLLNLVWIIFYLNALKDEDVSAVVPWFLSVPVFGYILGYFILGETLGINQILGGVIIIVGGLILLVKKSHETSSGFKLKWKPALYMFFASLFIALWGILFKFIATETNFWVSTFWENIGLFATGIFILIFVKNYREGFITMLRGSGSQIIGVNVFSEVLTLVGNLFNNYALLLAPVATVYLVGTIQPVVVFIMGIVCTLFFPSILKEDISKNNLIHKGIAIFIMTLGGIILLL